MPGVADVVGEEDEAEGLDACSCGGIDGAGGGGGKGEDELEAYEGDVGFGLEGGILVAFRRRSLILSL